MPSRANLAIYQGDDYAALVTVMNGSSTPPDLTGYTAQAQIRVGPADSNSQVVVQIVAQINGAEITLYIPADQTVGLRGKYAWDLQLTDSGGLITTILAGDVLVTPEVTR